MSPPPAKLYHRGPFSRYPCRIGARSLSVLRVLLVFTHLHSANYEITPRIGHDRSPPNTFKFVMVMKPIEVYKGLRLSYAYCTIYTVCLLHVSATLLAILRGVHYKGHITKTYLNVYMHLLVSSPYRINLMHGRVLFKTFQLIMQSLY